MRRQLWCGVLLLLAVALLGPPARGQEEPPALNPFGPRAAQRDDAVPGCVVLSDGTKHPGGVYLTRGLRLKILDEQQGRGREVPLQAVARIDCRVVKEWLEKEWRFRESASDVKVSTGRAYPARQYVHVITLKDGRTITGPLAGIVYVQPDGGGDPQRFLLHRRQSGETGQPLSELVYVRSVELRPAE